MQTTQIFKTLKDSEQNTTISSEEFNIFMSLFSDHISLGNKANLKFSDVLENTLRDFSISRINNSKENDLVESQINFFGDNFDNVTKKFEKLLSEENITRFSRVLGDVNTIVDDKEKYKDDILGVVGNMVSDLSNAITKKVAIIMCIIGVFISFRDKNYIIATLSTALLAYAYRNEMKTFLSKFSIIQSLMGLMKNNDSETNIELDQIQAEVGLSSYLNEISTALSLIVLGKECKGKNFFSGDNLRLFGTAKLAIQNVATLVLSVIEKIVYSFGYGDKYERIFMLTQNSDPVYRSFTEKVFKIDDSYREKTLTFTGENYSLIKETLSEGQKLLRDLPKNNSTQGLLSTMHSSLQRLSTYAKAFMDSGFMTEGLRQEPVAILLQGGPGTLKTQTMQHMAHALCSAVVDQDKRSAFETTPERFIYNRMIESEYWDKYNSDKIVCMFDDFLQIRDIAGGGDSEVFNLIRAVNENNYDLHMADIADKGNTSFQCKFVLCTSNSERLDVQSIHDKGALLRRFKFTYRPIPRKEFRKDIGRVSTMSEKVDMQKLPIGDLGITSTNPDDVLDFHEVDLSTGNLTGTILNFEEVVSRMLIAYNFNKKCYDQKVIELKKQREKYSKYSVVAQMNFWNTTTNDGTMPCEFKCEITESFKGILLNVNDEIQEFIMSRLQKLSASNRKVFSDNFNFILMHFSGYWVNMSQEQIICNLFENFSVRENIFRSNLNVLSFIEELENDVDFIVILPVECPELPEPSLMESLRERFVNSMSKVKEKLNSDVSYLEYCSWKNALILTSSLTAFVAIFISMKLYNDKQDTDDILKNPDEAEGDYSLRKSAKKKIVRRDLQSIRRSVVQSQISLVSDKQGEQIMDKILRHNVYEFSSRKDVDSPWCRLGYVTFIKGTIAIMPRHFIDSIAYRLEEDYDTMIKAEFRMSSATNANGGNKIVLFSVIDILSDMKETEVLKAQDLILVNLPDIQPRKDIMKHIMTEKDLINLSRKPICILGKTGKIISTVQTHGKLMKNVLVNDQDLEPYEIATTMAYNASTNKGDCGTLLGVLSPQQANRKICGLHVAGSPHHNLGYSSIFTLEMLEDCIDQFDDSAKISCNIDFVQSEFGESLVGDGRFNAYRDAPIAPSLPVHTSLIKSRISGQVMEPIMKPAKLRGARVDGIYRDPWVSAMSNYQMDVPILNKVVIDDATDQFKDYLFNNSDLDEERKLFTFDEAILGIPNTEFDSINRRTSPGYPDVVSKPSGYHGRGKELYFGKDVDFDLTGEYCLILKQRIENAIFKAVNLERSEFIFMDCLKDELRPIEKADDFKTRLISASPIDLLILYRMYFGAYNLWYKRNRINNQSAIGVNVYSQEWDFIAKKLQRFSPGNSTNIGAGDYSKFDGTEKPYIHNNILKIINDWYGDNEIDNRVRKVLWLELTNSIHIQGKCIYEWHTSLPSGHPMTPVVNTMYNGIAFRYCWNRAFSDEPKIKRHFNEYCYLIAMGDDNVFSVDGRFSDRFTEVIVGKYMKELGLNYTSETKDAVNIKMRHITDVEFLKRKWKYSSIAGRYVAPHQVTRQLEILNWSQKGALADSITIDNVDSVLRELSLHGKDIFDDNCRKISKISQELLGYHPKDTSYISNLESILDQEMYC
jgi:hypothetical protein